MVIGNEPRSSTMNAMPAPKTDRLLRVADLKAVQVKQLGMQIQTNPCPAASWPQGVGVISKENDDRNPPPSRP
jgi:hypothetical protein